MNITMCLADSNFTAASISDVHIKTIDNVMTMDFNNFAPWAVAIASVSVYYAWGSPVFM